MAGAASDFFRRPPENMIYITKGTLAFRGYCTPPRYGEITFMKRTFAALVFVLCAVTASAGTITSLSPSSIKVNSGEQFLTINGSSLSGPVTFSGPAGTFTLDANRYTTSYAAVWIPLQVTFKSGIYNVTVGNSNVATFTVQSVKSLPFALLVPEFVWKQPLNREGGYVKYDVSFVGDDPQPSIRCSPESGAFFKWGTTSVYCAGSNSYGEKAEAIFPVTVADRVAPKLTVPEYLYAKPGSNEGAIVDYDAKAYDDIYGDVVPVCYPKSGAMFPIGMNTVRCSALDADGNEGGATFVVQVSDEEPRPLIVVVPETIFIDAAGPKGEYVKYEVSVEKSEDPEPRVTCSQESGSLFPVGTTTVTCSALDRFGARGSASFDVEVVDPEAPVIEKLYATPDLLAQVDGRMWDVQIVASAFDRIDEAPVCSIYAVTSNEDIDVEEGEKNQEYQYMVTGPLTLQLRATRIRERYYDVWVGCTDYYGNMVGNRTRVWVEKTGAMGVTLAPTVTLKKRSTGKR
jgi:HYR domain